MAQITDQIKIALVDDHILLRDALAEVIAGFDNCMVTILANNGRHFIEQMRTSPSPGLVILDINMPLMDGFETARWIKQNHPAINILILTMFDSEIALMRLLQTGVKAFLKKDTLPSELHYAIESIVANGYYYAQNSSGKLAHSFLNSGRSFNTHPVKLSENEIRFLKFSSSDLTYKEIAKQMFISPRTVDNYRDSLFDKLNVKSRVGLAMYALKNGIVSF